MIRGEYHSKDPKTGLWTVLPNLFTLVGWNQILAAAFQGAVLDWDVGLCNTIPAVELTLLGIGEPTVGTGGYARQALAQNDTDWEEIGQVENESYVLSKEFTFPHAGPAYSGAVNRLFITDGVDVISVSSAFPVPITYDVASTHRYKLYFR